MAVTSNSKKSRYSNRGKNTRMVPVIKVFLKKTASPNPLKMPSNVKAIELKGCDIMTIQKVASKAWVTMGLSLNTGPKAV